MPKTFSSPHSLRPTEFIAMIDRAPLVSLVHLKYSLQTFEMELELIGVVEVFSSQTFPALCGGQIELPRGVRGVYDCRTH